jgi:hypothetical protein
MIACVLGGGLVCLCSWAVEMAAYASMAYEASLRLFEGLCVSQGVHFMVKCSR